jgi:hypothetical protein
MLTQSPDVGPDESAGQVRGRDTVRVNEVSKLEA